MTPLGEKSLDLSSVSVEGASFVKLKRAFSLKEAYCTGFLLDALIKLNGVSAGSLMVGSSGTKALRLRPVASCSVSDYLFFFSMFKSFFSPTPSRSLSSFSLKDLRSVNSGDKLLNRLKLDVLDGFSLLNFFYFLSFYYIPRLVSMGSGLTSFSVSAVFPDFTAYSHYYPEFSLRYPHYSVVMKRAGLFVFLDDFRIKFNFNVSSYILKGSYISYAQSEDWSLKFAAYYFLKKKDPLMIDFFRLQKSYLKIFVAGKDRA